MLDYKTLEVLNTFQSISEACRFINKSTSFCSTISSCCENKRFSAFGYRWCYENTSINNLRQKKKSHGNKGKKIKSSKGKKVKQFDLTLTFIKEWNSVKEAEQVFGKGISNNALGKSKTSNGYIWKY